MEAFIFILGLVIGSFLNVLIDRLPRGITIWGRSRCDRCGRELRWFELIPVASWIAQRGMCRRCSAPLSVQYPCIELVGAVGFVISYLFISQSTLLFITTLILFCSFLVIFVADLKYQIIPDSMVVVALAGTVALWLSPARSEVPFLPSVVSGTVASLFFYLLWRITGGRALGFGDVKLSFVLGFLLGYPLVVVALYAAFLTGAIVGVILILGRVAKLKSRIAFGPFLILGMVTALLFGREIIAWWRHLI